MTQSNPTVTITLLDKQYQVACDPAERDELMESARLLNQNMLKIRQSGAVIGLERIAVMSALNLAHELVKQQNSSATNDLVGAGIDRLRNKIDDAIVSLKRPLP
jgi:cell division protein ZapA